MIVMKFLFLTLVLTGALMLAPETLLGQVVKIDGAYQFVSETVSLQKPKKQQFFRKSPEWSGLFLFSDGYFSVSLMDNNRKFDGISNFPKNIRQIGYESFAGKYETSETTINFNPEVGLNLFFDVGRISVFKFKIEGESMTLTQTLSPYVEDMRKGEVVIVLKKVKSP